MRRVGAPFLFFILMNGRFFFFFFFFFFFAPKKKKKKKKNTTNQGQGEDKGGENLNQYQYYNIFIVSQRESSDITSKN
jgi:hypothetical protein